MNFINITHYALSAALAVYGVVVVVLIIALFKKGKGRVDSGINGCIDGDDAIPGVSVVIPFRNEEDNLGALLESLAKQSYKGRIEVIFVNDQSDDNGVDIIKKFCEVNDGIDIKIIDLYPSTDIKLTSKQQALDLGVETSSHPLIAFTDADMILSPNWIESLVSTQQSTQSALVFGHTAITEKQSEKVLLFTPLESFQLSYLFSFAHTFAKLNLAGSCMGNNVLITKDAYQQCGGQRGVGYTIVEDRALLELMRKKKFKTCAAEPFVVTARTYPSKTKRQFVNQMTRWAAGGLRPGGGLFLAGLLLLTQNVFFLIAIFSVMAATFFLLDPCICYRHMGNSLGEALKMAITQQTPMLGRQSCPIPGLRILPPAGIILTLTNFFLTWIFIALSFHKNRSPAPKWLFPVHYLFMMLETVVFGVMLVLRPKISWKGRKL